MDAKFPIGKLEIPDKVTVENVQEWLKEIEDYTIRLRETVDALNDEELNRTYRDGGWTVRQLVHHIADSQLNMYQRLKLALTDENPTVPAFDQDKWAIEPDTRLPVESSIKLLEGINERIVFLGYRLTEEQLDRAFTLQKSDEITVAAKVAKLAWHEEHHLSHIKIALSPWGEFNQ
ncbi:putative metal-dependent hydrolase [Salicibibacter cibi]|uniref:Putative metal-dependent hydrolase n=1 Tax=Salicibibacter cibi TaxID=2743001 RepID=A0A7T6ZDK8_9BACI|nr:putative metal-dependent hydrolase [Salicibibacter cibi]QQK81441.1 putative metal-dependent hydrolase [Salicibibacter cibi]